jgi:hypothetical protein
MEHYMQFAAISLEGVAAILGVFVAAGSFRLYRLQQRSENAARALVIVQNFVSYLKAIGEKQGLYENRDYYPDKIPEISFNDNERHWARPFRLIFNETNKFKKEFGEAIIKIAGKKFSSLNKILDEIEQLGRELSNLLSKKTEDVEHSKRMILEWMAERKSWFEKIDKIHNQAKCRLFPIINGESWCSTILMILTILSLLVLIA